MQKEKGIRQIKDIPSRWFYRCKIVIKICCTAGDACGTAANFIDG
jgi:hypothetical protein